MTLSRMLSTSSGTGWEAGTERLVHMKGYLPEDSAPIFVLKLRQVGAQDILGTLEIPH